MKKNYPKKTTPIGQPPIDSQKREVIPDEAQEKTKTLEDASKPHQVVRIIDRLDLQLLVAIIVFFVSAWAFLNGRICNFTESEPLNVQMSYIFVHYILTLVLFLCIVITAIKGNFVLRVKGEDVSEPGELLIRFFIESWFPILLLSVGILVTSSIIPWYYWCFIAAGLLFVKLWMMKLSLPVCLSFVLTVVIIFPLFISTMTVVMKDINVVVNKEYYSLSDDIVISVQTKGYACNHTLVSLGEKELYPNSKYDLGKGIIVIPAYCVKNNVISVGTVSPASGRRRFFTYPYRKILGMPDDNTYRRSKSSEHVYYKSKRITIQ